MSETSGLIFVSHASQDRHLAETLCMALEARGLNCWLANRDVAPGENFQIAIVRAILRSKAMLLIFTNSANNSDEIKKELALASQSKIVVIPLRLEDVLPTEAFAFELVTRQWVDMFDNWERALELLVKRLSAISARDAAEPRSAPATAQGFQSSARPDPSRATDIPRQAGGLRTSVSGSPAGGPVATQWLRLHRNWCIIGSGLALAAALFSYLSLQSPKYKSSIIDSTKQTIGNNPLATGGATDNIEDRATEDAARQEAARQAAARQEAAREEAARQEAARQEAARQEAARQEAARQDAAAQLNRQELDRRRTWDVWQQQMRAEFQRVRSIAGSPTLQLAAWDHFLNAWKTKNPYSDEDSEMRAQAQHRKQELVTVIKANGNSPPSLPGRPEQLGLAPSGPQPSTDLSTADRLRKAWLNRD